MLDAFIIEELKRREERERERDDRRPVLELPVHREDRRRPEPQPTDTHISDEGEGESDSHGVVIIEMAPSNRT